MRRLTVARSMTNCFWRAATSAKACARLTSPIPTIHCGGCIQKIEQALGVLPGVEQARVNLSARRVTIRWRADNTPAPFIETLRRIGYEAHLYDSAVDPKDGVAELVRALAVAGFAASNIMLLSVSIWSGADPETRDLFHGFQR